MSDLLEKIYNPDVLTCLANLSSDEVFTPPEMVSQMLDRLPQELFQSSRTTFLDPACKSGIFLREIAKRLLKARIPEYEERSRQIAEKKRGGIPLDAGDGQFERRLQKAVDHIFHKQVFGIAITELTGLMSRRSVYCSKYPNSDFSITRFETEEGNIRFRRMEHSWDKYGKCVFCGASRSQYERGGQLETHAYEWIHTKNPEEIFGMHFDVICGNPPYMLSDGGGGAGKSAAPLYQKFVEQAKLLRPRYLTMIIPSRWFNGGKGLDQFRASMLNDSQLKEIVDYADSKECFAGVDIPGGICYFLWEKGYHGTCRVTNIMKNGKVSTQDRTLNEFSTFIRHNEALSIVKKAAARNEAMMSERVSSRKPFGLESNTQFDEDGDIVLRNSKGLGKIRRERISAGTDLIDKWKVIVSKVSFEHAGIPDKDGMMRVLSVIQVLPPQSACTESYLVVDTFEEEASAENCASYLKTKFARFLIMQMLASMNMSKASYQFTPVQDFSEHWTDEKLYAKYGLDDGEIDFIESMVRPMDSGGGD